MWYIIVVYHFIVPHYVVYHLSERKWYISFNFDSNTQTMENDLLEIYNNESAKSSGRRFIINVVMPFVETLEKCDRAFASIITFFLLILAFFALFVFFRILCIILLKFSKIVFSYTFLL